MYSLSFAIVSCSLILREGLFTFLRDAGYSPYCITRCNTIDEFDRSESKSNHIVLIVDDSRLSSASIYDILSQYASPSPKLRIIIVSCHLNVNYIGQIVEYPNTGFVFHGDLDQHLMGVMDMLNLNMMSISPTALNLYLDARRILEMGSITDSDLEVLHCFADGLTVEEMVNELDISQRTIYRIRNKWREVLDVPTSDLIVDKARQLGLFS